MSILSTWITSGHLFTIGELSDLWGGWLDLMSFATVTFAYSSADSPTFVMSSNVDLTGILQPGMRVRLVQSSTTKYFIVTAVSAYAAGSMTITLLAPNDGTTLANVAITACAFSSDKAPFGFPTDPTKWFWQTLDTANRTQTSPVAGTWYNIGSGALSLVVPIGAWRLGYIATAGGASGVAANINVFATLSTGSSSESDTDFTSNIIGNTALGAAGQVNRDKHIVLASKTTYFLNVKTSTASLGDVDFYGANGKTIIRASSAYL